MSPATIQNNPVQIDKSFSFLPMAAVAFELNVSPIWLSGAAVILFWVLWNNDRLPPFSPAGIGSVYKKSFLYVKKTVSAITENFISIGRDSGEDFSSRSPIKHAPPFMMDLLGRFDRILEKEKERVDGLIKESWHDQDVIEQTHQYSFLIDDLRRGPDGKNWDYDEIHIESFALWLQNIFFVLEPAYQQGFVNEEEYKFFQEGHELLMLVIQLRGNLDPQNRPLVDSRGNTFINVQNIRHETRYLVEDRFQSVTHYTYFPRFQDPYVRIKPAKNDLAMVGISVRDLLGSSDFRSTILHMRRINELLVEMMGVMRGLDIRDLRDRENTSSQRYAILWALLAYEGMIKVPIPNRDDEPALLAARLENNILWAATVTEKQLAILAGFSSQRKLPLVIVDF
jgi:hypothetical protein